LGISTVRDRVCMTAAMLVLEPIFEADLPPEQYAYRPRRNAQQAVVEWKRCCSVATRKSWTPTSRTTSEAFRMPNFSSR
jgi:retron-type reverse transcriptase